MEEYKFELIERNLKSTKYDFSISCTIRATKGNLAISSTNMDFSTKHLENRFLIDKLEFSAIEGDSSDTEHLGFLRGYFEFEKKENIYKAINSLKQTLVGQYIADNINDKWKDFRNEFVDWYGKFLKPIIEEEIEIFKKCSRLEQVNN